MADRPSDTGPWPGDPRPREQWSIASAETLTADEEANLATMIRYAVLYQNRSDDFESIQELVIDPYVIHGPKGTRTERPGDVKPDLIAFRERSPGYEGWFDDVFVGGDLVARRLRYHYPEPLPGRGSLQCGIAIYRFENYRIVEYWNAYLPIDMGFD